ncbi:MAG: ATP-binding protein [Elusimicrobia bacterium]|nr:ATP-binding protein [Elusimicrobiota bacterium]
MKERYLMKQIQADLKQKMVFVGGPRQVGKTTLAKTLLGHDQSGYLNWDVDEHRERILKGELPVSPIWVFDELHKFRSWRNFLKGLYDGKRPGQRILVTGSGRLDFYRFGGDSLQGRYHYLRLYPFSVAELRLRSRRDFQELLDRGGFPEPYLGGTEVGAKRWSREYRSRLIRDDLSSLEQVQDVGKMELLMMRLPDLVGSPLSINSLREDLRVSHKTVSHWLLILERLYAIFRLPPYGTTKIRAVQKEQKHYHFDWSLVKAPGLRLENLVAMHLLKWAHFQEDAFGRGTELRYFRDVRGQEIDFIVLEDGRPLHLVECKWDDVPPVPALRYLKARVPNCQAWQISAVGKKDYVTPDGIRVCPAQRFLEGLV